MFAEFLAKLFQLFGAERDNFLFFVEHSHVSSCSLENFLSARLSLFLVAPVMALARGPSLRRRGPQREGSTALILGGDEECPAAAVHQEQGIAGILVHGVVEVRDILDGLMVYFLDDIAFP